MANKAPGVYLSEVSYSASNASKNVNVTVILGTASKGPIEPIEVFSQKHAEELFGPELNNDFGLTALFKIAEEAESVIYCRVINNGSKAKFQFEGKDIFIAKEGGTHLNNAKVNAEVNEDLTICTVTVSEDDVVKECVVCSLDVLAEDFIGFVFNNNSTLLNLAEDIDDDFDFTSLSGDLTVVAGEVGAALPSAVKEEDDEVLKVQGKTFGTFLNGATFKVHTTVDKKWGAILTRNNLVIESIPLGKAGETMDEFKARVNQVSGQIEVTEISLTKSAIVTLAGGNSGLVVDDDDYVDALRKIADPTQYDITTLIIPGVSSAKVLNFAQQLATQRQDFLFIADPPMGLRSYQTVNWVEAVGLFAGSSRLTSSYVAVYSPWVKTGNFAGEVMFIPPSILVAQQLAKNDRIHDIWQACAGVNRGVLEGVSGLEYLPTNDDINILYTNSVVNPIVYMKDRGYVIWGNKTCRRPSSQSSNEPTCSVNVRRLVNYIKRVVRNICADFVFEINDEITWAKFKLEVEPRLRAIQEARGLYKFEVIMDETTVTADKINALEMPGIIRLWPTRVAEVITVAFEIYPQGVDFANGEVDE